MKKKEKERWREEEKDERKREGECESPLSLTTIPGSIVTPTYRGFPSLELSLLLWWISLLFVIWAPFKLTGIPSFIAALFTIARTWKQPRRPLTDEWIKVWYIYSMQLLLSHKKVRIWVSSNEVDEPRAYYTEWSKSERKK